MTQDETTRWLVTAKRYLSAAREILKSPDYGHVLHVPTLHLTAHGIEILLKAHLIKHGATEEVLRTEFGHDLFLLWQHQDNLRLRKIAIISAQESWVEAKTKDFDDTFEENPERLLLEYLNITSKLHTKDTKYALRYVPDKDLRGPQPHLLVDTFLKTADFLLKQPNAEL